MGEIGARLADVLVVTDDNPRTEDPAAIRAAVLAGARRRSTGGPRCSRSATVARRSARAVAMAGAGDTVVVAGKGHETGQEIAGVVHPFDDRDEVRAALEARGRPMIALTPGARSRASWAGRRRRRPGVRRSTGPAFLDSRVAGARRPVRRLRGRAGRRPRLRRRRVAAARPRCWARGPPACPPSWSTDVAGGPAGAGPARAAPRCGSATRAHGRRAHRLAGQDHHQGPARPGARRRRRRRSRRPARSTTSSGCRSPCCGPTGETRYLVLEMGARGIGHLTELVRDRAARHLAGAQRRQGPHRRVRLAGDHRAGQGRAGRGALGRRRRGAQRRRPAGGRDGRAHAGPGRSVRPRAGRRRRARRRRARRPRPRRPSTSPTTATTEHVAPAPARRAPGRQRGGGRGHRAGRRALA